MSRRPRIAADVPRVVDTPAPDSIPARFVLPARIVVTPDAMDLVLALTEEPRAASRGRRAPNGRPPGLRVVSVDEGPMEGLGLPYVSAVTTGTECRRVEVWRARVEGLPADVDALICTSDLQGRALGAGGELLGVALAGWIGELQDAGRIPPPSRCAAVLAGDVGAVWRAFAARARWVVGVLGNHDEPPAGPLPEGVRILDDATADIGGLRVAGVGGIIGRADRPGRRDAAAYVRCVRRSLDNDVDLLVLHESPAAPEIGGLGNMAIRQALAVAAADRRGVPRLVVSGHSSWSQVHTREPGGIHVINVHGRVVLCTR